MLGVQKKFFNFFTPTYIPQNDQRDAAVVLRHVCWGPGAHPNSRPPDPPPPPPSMEGAGKWDGVGLWPVAVPPPPPGTHPIWRTDGLTDAGGKVFATGD